MHPILRSFTHRLFNEGGSDSATDVQRSLYEFFPHGLGSKKFPLLQTCHSGDNGVRYVTVYSIPLIITPFNFLIECLKNFKLSNTCERGGVVRHRGREQDGILIPKGMVLPTSNHTIR